MTSVPTTLVQPFGSVLSANTSFVTSYPGDKDDKDADNDYKNAFKYPASENAALLKILEGKDPKQDTTKENLHQLFKDSISKLNEQIILSDRTKYSAVGLQELNNTEEVHNYVTGFIGVTGSDNTFFCNNVFEGSTFPTLGYIVNQPIASFKPKKSNVEELFYTPNKSFVKSEIWNTLKNFDISKCFSIGNEGEKCMAIRDLGVIEDNQDNQHDFVLAKSYSATNKLITPDWGRPISMIICTNPKVIHINCQMVNPSVLKKYIHGSYPATDDDDKKKPNLLKETNCIKGYGNLKTLSELKTDNDALQLWVDYCKRRLEQTIPQLLSDFGIKTVEGIEGYSWVLTGDLNDGFGYLRQTLSRDGINIFGIKITFVFDEKTTLKTCCPNTNSSKITLNTPDNVTIKENALSMKLDKTIKDQVENIDDVNKIFDTKKFIFEGDQVAFYIPDKTITTTLEPLQSNFSEMTSDHIFVIGTVEDISEDEDENAMGGRKKTKKNKKNKKRIQKQTKKRKQKTNKNRKRKYKKSHKK